MLKMLGNGLKERMQLVEASDMALLRLMPQGVNVSASRTSAAAR